jgi:hypothetical protein
VRRTAARGNAANQDSRAHSRRPATRGNAALAIADATHQLQLIQVTVVDPYRFAYAMCVHAVGPPQDGRARESETYSKVNWCARDRND